MKKPVHNHPVQFFIKLGSIINGIFADRIDAYEKISGDNGLFGIVKGDYIGKITVGLNSLLKARFAVWALSM